MKKIYISSTFSDLVEYRRVLYEQLRSLRLDPIAMEDYVAADNRPTEKCLRDVEIADLYIGIVAWRYGFVPDDQVDTGSKLSITELEYRKALEKGKGPLVFLAAKDAPWDDNYRDSVTGEGGGGARIRDLRETLEKRHVVGYFGNPDELARKASAAVQSRLGHRRARGAIVFLLMLISAGLWNQLRPRNPVEMGLLTPFHKDELPAGYIIWCEDDSEHPLDVNQDSAYFVSFPAPKLEKGSYRIELSIQPGHTFQTRFLSHDESFRAVTSGEQGCPAPAVFEVDAPKLAGTNRIIVSLRRPRGQAGKGSRLVVNVRDVEKNDLIFTHEREIRINEW